MGSVFSLHMAAPGTAGSSKPSGEILGSGVRQLDSSPGLLYLEAVDFEMSYPPLRSSVSLSVNTGAMVALTSQ